MAYHPARGLCDPFGGQADLRRGVLRAVGDPDTRFAEDALRILRGVRFQAQTGFALEPQTAYAMRRQLARLDGIARERVLAELNGILTGRYAGRALRACREILAAVLPELSPMFGLCQHNPHHRYDVWEHTVRAVEAVPADLTLRWVMLLHDCGKPHAYTIDAAGVGHFKGHPRISCALAAQALARLRAPGALREAVCRLVNCMTIRWARTRRSSAAGYPGWGSRPSGSCWPSKKPTAPARAHFLSIWRTAANRKPGERGVPCGPVPELA